MERIKNETKILVLKILKTNFNINFELQIKGNREHENINSTELESNFAKYYEINKEFTSKKRK